MFIVLYKQKLIRFVFIEHKHVRILLLRLVNAQARRPGKYADTDSDRLILIYFLMNLRS